MSDKPDGAKAHRKHRWTFFRASGVTQAAVRTAEDIRRLTELPEELWTILSCPSSGLQFDQKTFDFMDNDHDGHIRVREVVMSIEWLLKRLRDPADIFRDSTSVQLSAFSDTDEGKALREASELLLASVGKKGADTITLDDVMVRQTTFINAPFNGDGVITAAATEDETVKRLIGEIIAATGGTPDRSGAAGVDKAKVEEFTAALEAHLAWLGRATAEKDSLFPLGDATADAAKALDAVKAKINDYFLRCRLASFDAAAKPALNASDYAAVSSGDITSAVGAISAFPISIVEADAPLALDTRLNPAWRDAVASFVSLVVRPILGEVDSLAEAEWRSILAKFAPYEAWRDNVGGACVASLGEARVKEILADAATKEEVLRLCAKDLDLSSDIAVLNDIEKFVRLHANLDRFLHNYVNFSDYYDPAFDEIFRAGNLYIDGRVCRLCIDIADMGSHATLAASSKLFLAYCEITRSQTKQKKTICAMVTAGFAASIWVGRHGIFYDREMNDWEAVVVKIQDAPVSLKEAFWSPWLKISDMLNAQINKLLSSKQDAMLGAASAKVGTIGTDAPAAPEAAPAAKPDGAAMASSVAAIGIAVGLVGSAIGGLVSTISGLPLWKTLLGIVAVFLIVSGPSVILAWFKIRNRDLAPVLNACGWAVNKKLKMNTRLGREFTREAVIPIGSKIELTDPYVRNNPVRRALAIIVLAAILIWLGHSFGILRCPFKCCLKCHPQEETVIEAEPDCAHEPLEGADDAAPSAPAAVDETAAEAAADGQ